MSEDASSAPVTVGLSASEAQARLKREGYKDLPRTQRRTPLRIVIEVMREPMLALLAGGGAVYLLLGRSAGSPDSARFRLGRELMSLAAKRQANAKPGPLDNRLRPELEVRMPGRYRRPEAGGMDEKVIRRAADNSARGDPRALPAVLERRAWLRWLATN